MNLAELSIKRPIFITCIVIATIAVGILSYRKLGVDMLPNVTFPVVTVSIPYPGAAPAEIETLVSKIVEDEISNVPGIKSLKSISREGVGIVVADFTLETDIKYAEQQIRDRVATAKRKLPAEIKEPLIRKLSPSDQPVLYIALQADLPPGKLYDLAQEEIKPRLEQVQNVGLVEVIGGRKRQISVELDPKKLKSYELSSSLVVNRLGATGLNIPLGKITKDSKDIVLRTLGEFKSLDEIETAPMNFFGNDVSVMLKDVGTVSDSLEDELSRSFVNGKPALFLLVFRQSGANTLKVADQVKERLGSLNDQFKKLPGSPALTVVRDASKFVKMNSDDVQESILLGITLTVIVVFLFLGSIRSTIITGLALPNSLLGACIFMGLAGFTLNSMTLLALSLSVGLLVDDAIVVRENIYRHIEMGKKPLEAALFGTKEVSMAVVATTCAVLSVFGPVGFLTGVVGQFFREFAFTICIAMVISLYDSLTIAPMLSAYFAGSHKSRGNFVYRWTLGLLVDGFEKIQQGIEWIYERVLKFSIRMPLAIFVITGVVLYLSVMAISKVPKTFLTPQDFGEFAVKLELPPGTSLDGTNKVADEIITAIEKNSEIAQSTMVVGDRDGQANVAEFSFQLVPRSERTLNTSEFKDKLREQLKPFAFAHPKVTDVDFIGGGLRPFTVNIIGNDWDQLLVQSKQAFDLLAAHPGLTDVEYSYKPGKPEAQIILDKSKAAGLGVTSNMLGGELRTMIDGATASFYRENGREYDIKVRLNQKDRDLAENFNSIYIPNINNTLLKLKDVATLKFTEGPTTINRQDRARYVQISADIKANGPGMGAVMSDLNAAFETTIKLPPGMRYAYVGQAESFKELQGSLVVAFLLAILFTYLVLSSLYESFVTPFTIMLVLPLALCGAFIALYFGKSSLDINSMIGCILLLGLATKNSILLVDYANQQVAAGVSRSEAIYQAGKTRLRPILMTTLALIAGTLPIAIGLNEASKQRTPMGIAVIGGLISSMLLTLVVVPASFSYIDRFRVWARDNLKRIFVSSN